MKFKPIFCFAFYSALVVFSLADPVHHMQERTNLTDELWGVGSSLESSGVDFSLSMTNIYQLNAKGGQSTHRRQGRWSGSYDLEMTADLQKLLGVENAELYMLAEGTWSRRDIDQTSVGSAFGVNGDFVAPREAFNIIEFWYQQSYFEQTLKLRLGKLDMTGGFECRGCAVSFDGNAYANDENTQFLNSALVNNPTIPFPDYGLGAIVYWNPVEHWYLSAGVADAQADRRETGFNTTFAGEDYFVYMAETGLTPQLDSANGPLQGAYRAGLWYDPQPKAHSDADRLYRDDAGMYLSFDQALTKETDWRTMRRGWAHSSAMVMLPAGPTTFRSFTAPAFSIRACSADATGMCWDSVMRTAPSATAPIPPIRRITKASSKCITAP